MRASLPLEVKYSPQPSAAPRGVALSSILDNVSAKLKKLATLSKRGPHRVLVGDLSYAGLPGQVYTPAEGKNLPAIAFGHDWRRDIKHYRGTLRHLASWGIVVVAPNTELGVFPNTRNQAADLESSLQIAAGVKLGEGNAVVSPHKLGLVGHGMGAGAAVLAAVDNEKVKAVAALYPAKTAPSADIAARELEVPGLVIGSGLDDILTAANPAKLAHNWGGEVAYREIAKGTQRNFSEDRLAKLAFAKQPFAVAPMETARGLLTGFLLHQLDNDKTYSDYSAADATGKNIESFSGDDLADKAGFNRDNR